MLKDINQKFSKLLNDKHLSELLRGGATTFYLRLVGYAIALLLIILITRTYGAKVFGEYSLAITVLTISSLFVRLGFESSMVKLFSPRVAINDWDSIRIIYKKILKIIFVLGIVVSTLLFFGSDYLANELFNKPSFSLYIKIAALIVIPFSLRLINADSYRGFKNMKGYAYSKHISYYLYALVILVVLTLYSKNDLNPIIAYATGLIFLCISSTYILLKKIKSKVQKISEESISSKAILDLSIPMLLSSASVLLSTHLIKLIMGVYHSTEFVGIFNATLNVVLIQNFIQAATNSIAGPKLAEVNRLENRKELGVIARHTTNINTYLTIPVTLFLLLFNKPLLSILGKEFIVGSDAFLIMLLGNFITVLCGPTSVFMNMTGLQKVLRNIIMLSLVISSIVAFVFIPKYGIIGGAISYSVFIVSWNIICSVYVKIKTGINLFFWPFKLNN